MKPAAQYLLGMALLVFVVLMLFSDFQESTYETHSDIPTSFLMKEYKDHYRLFTWNGTGYEYFGILNYSDVYNITSTNNNHKDGGGLD